MTTPLSKVINKLDLLDGTKNGYYTNSALHISNATGVCEIVERTTARAKKKGLPISGGVALLRNPKDQYIHVDCDALVKKLDRLANIAARIPALKFFARAKTYRKGQPKPKVPTAQDFYGFHIVDHMIIALLRGYNKATQPYHKLFADVEFKVYTKSVHRIGRIYKKAGLIRRDFSRLNIQNAKQAYRLFRRLGRKYRFNTTPFKPRPSTP